MSLKRALEILGIGHCYHFTEVLRRHHAARWLAILDGEPPDWNDLFSGYSATVDWPAVTYYRELANYYPKAKVILTVRDPDEWHASIVNALLPLRRTLPSWIPWASTVGRLTDRVIWEGAFAGRAAEKDFAVAQFHRHRQEVCAEIPEDRLLIFDVKEGWEPLCQFLGCPIPDAPFPRSNSRRSIRSAVWAIRGVKWLTMAALILTGVGLLALVTPWR
jgi:hypothetical protein